MPRQNELNDIVVDFLSLIGLDILKNLIGPLLVYMVYDYVGGLWLCVHVSHDFSLFF